VTPHGDARTGRAGSRLSLSGLRTRLLLLVLLVLLPILGLMLYTALSERREAANKAQRTALRLARVVAVNQEQLSDEARQLLITLAQAPQVRSDDVTCNVYLSDLLRRWPRYANLGVVAPGGTVVCSAVPGQTSVDERESGFFEHVLSNRDFARGEYRIDGAGGRAIVEFGYPVLDDRGRVLSVVFAMLSLDWLNELAADAQLTPGTTLTVLDHGGTVLGRYPEPERWIGRSLPTAPIVEAVLARREGATEARGLDGIPRFYGFTPLLDGPGVRDVYVAAGMPRAAALAEPSRQLKRDLVVLGAIGALTLVAAWAGGYFFLLRPMDALARAARRLSAGDLSARTGLHHERGELGELSQTFDEMADSLERREEELRQLNDELDERVRERTAQLESANHDLEQALASLTEEKERVEALYQFGEQMASESEFQALSRIVLTELCESAAADVGTLYAIEDESDLDLALSASHGLDSDRLPARLRTGEGLAGRAAVERRVVAASYGETRLRLPAFGEEVSLQHELHVPLLHGDRSLGVASVARLADEVFSPGDVDMIEHLAAQAAVALSNAVSLASARRQASINRAVLDATVEGIGLIDPQGNTLLANASMERMSPGRIVGIDGADAVDGRSPAVAEHTADPQAYLGAVEAIESDPDWVGADEYELAASGRSFERYTAPVRNPDGKLLGRIFTIRELTAERKAERLKSELLATVEHELRRPLASIFGYAELLVARDLDEATRESYLDTIYRESGRLTTLVNDFQARVLEIEDSGAPQSS
jgi:HAMP domain-containing protein